MPQNRNEPNDGGHTGTDQTTTGSGGRNQTEDVNQASRWFAATAVRAGLTFIGVVLLLFALGQAVGLPFLEMATDVLSTQTGQWLVVAFFAVLLIGAAQQIVTTR